MKSITLILYNRPEYTRETIRSLGLCNLDGYHVYVAIDHSEKVDKIIRIVSNDLGCPHTFHVNSPKLGVNYNNFDAIDFAFNNGSDFNICIEDDTPITPDTIDMANWFYDLPERDKYFNLNFFSMEKEIKPPLDLVEIELFCPWGWAMTKKVWESHVRPNWMCNPKGWDWSMTDIMKKAGMKAIYPLLSRSRNIGRNGGTYENPRHYDQTFAGHVCSAGGYGEEFRIV